MQAGCSCRLPYRRPSPWCRYTATLTHYPSPPPCPTISCAVLHIADGGASFRMGVLLLHGRLHALSVFLKSTGTWQHQTLSTPSVLATLSGRDTLSGRAALSGRATLSGTPTVGERPIIRGLLAATRPLLAGEIGCWVFGSGWIGEMDVLLHCGVCESS